jgi:hypothetical protein
MIGSRSGNSEGFFLEPGDAVPRPLGFYTIAADPAVSAMVSTERLGRDSEDLGRQTDAQDHDSAAQTGAAEGECFLVHGRDHETMNQVRVFLRDRLHFEPVVG